MSQYYKKYMKKREEEKPSYLKLFVGAFLMMLVFFGIFITHSLSSVDISIGENDEGEVKESGLGVKHLIDSRLRFIQMEDISGVNSTKEKEKYKSNIEEYGKTVQEEVTKGYSGNYQNSYGYDSTQQTKPYSQTYTQTNSTQQAPKPVTVATPAVTHTAPKPVTTAPTVPSPKPVSTPSHNIQKNLTPTGM